MLFSINFHDTTGIFLFPGKTMSVYNMSIKYLKLSKEYF